MSQFEGKCHEYTDKSWLHKPEKTMFVVLLVFLVNNQQTFQIVVNILINNQHFFKLDLLNFVLLCVLTSECYMTFFYSVQVILPRKNGKRYMKITEKNMQYKTATGQTAGDTWELEWKYSEDLSFLKTSSLHAL